MNRVVVVVALASLSAGPVLADSILGGKLAGLAFNQDAQGVKAALTGHCGGLRDVEIESPNFPLARESEAHVICEAFTDGAVKLDTLALTLADDRLVLLYARGNADALESLSEKALEDWMHFRVSWQEMLVVDGEAGQAWIMSDEAAHPNLFQWPNPYLRANEGIEYAPSAARPPALQFGGGLEDLQPQFEAACAFTHLAEYPVWLLNKPDDQQQLDCFGIEYAGFPRKIEAVFGDGILHQAWILTGAGEEDRVRAALVEAFGPAEYADHDWEIFDDGRVMLRKDKPEVLMLSDDLVPLFRTEYIDGED